MAFAVNRIGVNYHKLGNNIKSLKHHKDNIELSDFENVFAGYYNSGICLRNIGHLDDALDAFRNALQWSISKNVNFSYFNF